MDFKQSCNVFLPVKQYEEIKNLAHRLNVSYSELIREGVTLVLKRHKGKQCREFPK